MVSRFLETCLCSLFINVFHKSFEKGIRMINWVALATLCFLCHIYTLSSFGIFPSIAYIFVYSQWFLKHCGSCQIFNQVKLNHPSELVCAGSSAAPVCYLKTLEQIRLKHRNPQLFFNHFPWHIFLPICIFDFGIMFRFIWPF